MYSKYISIPTRLLAITTLTMAAGGLAFAQSGWSQNSDGYNSHAPPNIKYQQGHQRGNMQRYNQGPNRPRNMNRYHNQPPQNYNYQQRNQRGHMQRYNQGPNKPGDMNRYHNQPPQNYNYQQRNQ